MKNCKPFPCPDSPDWLAVGFLSDRQRTACRALFPAESLELALSVIDLTRLQQALTAPGQTLVATYLDPLEQERLHQFTFAKRQLEWLGGRMAAKRAALALMAQVPGLAPAFPHLRVDSESSGRPYLCAMHAVGAPLPAISISHSHGLAGALAVQGHGCGLDLQRITPKVIAIRDRFASSAERTLLCTAPGLQGQDEAALLTLLWAGKEALRKGVACQPILGFTEITLSRLEGNLLTGMVCRFTSSRPALTPPPVFLALSDPFACAIMAEASSPLPESP
jgi:phosphopantetheinyl transferase